MLFDVGKVFVGKARSKAKKKTTGARAKRDRRRRQASEASASAAELLAQAPSIDSLTDVPAFADLPVDDAQQEAYRAFCAAAEEPEQMLMGAVVRLDRGFPLVASEGDTFRAEHAVGFAKARGEGEVLLPAVGDRVAVRRAPGHDMGVIECVLPRRTSFERWRGGARGEHQVLCSNLDTVLIVQALGAGEVLLDRIARSLVLALDCGATPVVVLTKADRCGADELAEDLECVHRLVGSGVRVIVTSSAEGRGLDEVRACVPAGSCAMILGESGAGKSTLLNALLGHEALATGGVRERDDQGRHTTVARTMVALPGDAGVIADAPGLRSLPLVGHERGLARAFPEIVEASHACRFGDCTHTHEPGCAVREAEDTGEIDSLRLEMFLSLASSMRVSAQMLDPDVHLD